MSKRKPRKIRPLLSPESKKKERLAKEKQEKEDEERRLLEEEEIKKAKQAAYKELREQARRDELLKSACAKFKDLNKLVEKLDWEKRQLLEWEKYVNCGNLPIAHNIPMMNTYLFMLKAKQILWNVDYCFEMSPKLLNLIETVDDYIANPLGASYRRISNWKEVRQGYRNVIAEGIDMMCYELVKNLSKNLTAIDLWTYEFRKSCEHFFIGIWAFGEYPKLTGYPNQDFPEVGVDISLPHPFDRQSCVLRLIKLSYNHLNDQCVTWTCPNLPTDYNTDLYQNQSDWFYEKIRMMDRFKLKEVDPELDTWCEGMFFNEILKNVEKKIPPKIKTKIYDINELREYLRMTTDSQFVGARDEEGYTFRKLQLDSTNHENNVTVPLDVIVDTMLEEKEVDLTFHCQKKSLEIQTLQELLEEFEIPNTETKAAEQVSSKIKDHDEERLRVFQMLEEMEKTYTEQIIWKQLKTEVPHGEINLRKSNIIGNLYSIELFLLPLQEVLLKDKSKLTTIQGDKCLERYDFHIKYVPPSITEEKQEEDDTPKQKKHEDPIDKLLKVTLTLEENCLWFEPPHLVQWDSSRECWTNDFIVDPKFNEEKQEFTFRTGRLGVFGFAVQRYSNLPFQTWDLRPEDDETVLFNITASTIIIDFQIKRDQVCILQVQNTPSSVLDPLLNVYYDVPILIKNLRRLGLDIFPEYDSFCYVDGSTYKDILTENHTYACMALFSSAYNFSWSRWNSFAGRNKIVFQMRESIDKSSAGNYQMIACCLDRAVIVDCTEVSPAFTDKGIPGSDYYPDLYSIICYTASEAVQTKIKSTHPYLYSTVYKMLMSTRVFTFS